MKRAIEAVGVGMPLKMYLLVPLLKSLLLNQKVLHYFVIMPNNRGEKMRRLGTLITNYKKNIEKMTFWRDKHDALT